MTDIKLADGTPERPAGEGVLTPEALRFLGELGERFSSRVAQLLRARELRQERLDAGELPDFLPETGSVREGDWRVGPIPTDLQDRRVEPVEARGRRVTGLGADMASVRGKRHADGAHRAFIGRPRAARTTFRSCAG